MISRAQLSVWLSFSSYLEKSSLNPWCFSEEEFCLKPELPSPLKILCLEQKKKTTSSVPEKCHSSSNTFPAAGKICSRRWRKQGCDYPAFQNAPSILRWLEGAIVLEAYRKQKREEQFIRLFFCSQTYHVDFRDLVNAWDMDAHSHCDRVTWNIKGLC